MLAGSPRRLLQGCVLHSRLSAPHHCHGADEAPPNSPILPYQIAPLGPPYTATAVRGYCARTLCSACSYAVWKALPCLAATRWLSVGMHNCDGSQL